jgi:hypothetical protein
MGVVVRDAHDRIRLNESYFAFCELTVMLRALGGERVVVIPSRRAGPVPRRVPPLFGSPARTRVLVALDALDSANVADLAFTARVSRSTTRAVLAFFVNQRILRFERDARELHATFEDAAPVVPVLRALLRRLATADPHLGTRTQLVRTRIAERNAVHEPTRVNIALPFGTAPQAAALVALARCGPLRTARLAALNTTTPNAVRSAADVLERAGLIVTRVYGRGPTAARWLALNPAHPLTAPLCRYVAAAVPAAAPAGPLPPRGFPFPRPCRSRHLPGPPLRTRAFCAAYESGEVSIAELARRLGRRERVRLRRWSEDLRASGLVAYGPLHGRLTLRRREDPPALGELAEALLTFLTP